MLITLVVALALRPSGANPPLYCPVTLRVVKAPVARLVYAGSTFGMCTASCEASFRQDAATLIAKAAKANKAVGAFQFDPISGIRIEPKDSGAFSDYKAIRYYFASKDEKKTFDSGPGRFAGEVTAESFHCPVMETDTTFAEAQSYADYKGVRYFMCCSICVKKFRADPTRYAKNATDKIKPLSIVKIEKRSYH